MSTLSYTTFNLFKGIAEYFIAVPKDSAFYEKGTLTPDEFVRAGDLIVTKCPTWSWSAGDADKRKDFLPADKQFLITKNVPCLKRAKALELDNDELNVEDDWVETHTSLAPKEKEEVEDINAGDDDDGILDIEDYKEEDDDAVNNDKNSLFVKTRTYDISITYDKFYNTPRVWLFGYDENGKPLDPMKILEDVHGDYSLKTVTIEQHPHLSAAHASIHPCKHAEVMKKMVDQLASNGKYVRVDLYLYLFLKFISAVVPTIEYDFTIKIET